MLVGAVVIVPLVAPLGESLAATAAAVATSATAILLGGDELVPIVVDPHRLEVLVGSRVLTGNLL